MYQMPELTKYNGLVHAFSTKEQGNMSFNWGDQREVAANRRRFLRQANIDPQNTVAMSIKHINNFGVVKEGDKGRGVLNPAEVLTVDGLATDQKGVFLLLMVADCQPIIMLEPKRKIVGLFHAGWRNIVSGSALAIIKFLQERFDCEPADLVTVIGPSVQQDSYRHPKLEQQGMPGWEPYVKKYGENDFGLDLIGYQRDQFLKLGVLKGNLYISPFDTAQDERFYSHVYDQKHHVKREGRFACLVGWK